MLKGFGAFVQTKCATLYMLRLAPGPGERIPTAAHRSALWPYPRLGVPPRTSPKDCPPSPRDPPRQGESSPGQSRCTTRAYITAASDASPPAVPTQRHPGLIAARAVSPLIALLFLACFTALWWRRTSSRPAAGQQQTGPYASTSRRRPSRHAEAASMADFAPRRASQNLAAPPSAIPPPPPLPPSKTSYFSRFVTQPLTAYGSRPPSAQTNRPDGGRPNPLVPKLPG